MNKGKNNVWIILSFVLVCSILIYVICINKNQRLINEIAIKDSLIGSWGMSQSRLDYLQNSIYIGHRYGCITLNDQIVTDTVKNVTNLAGIVADAHMLVFRFEEGQCQNCILFGMLKLETFSKNSFIKTAVFANYHDHHSFKTVNRVMNKTNLPIYNVKNLDVLDQLHAPYFFIIEKELSVRNVFVPEKAFPDITNRYFETIKHL